MSDGIRSDLVAQALLDTPLRQVYERAIRDLRAAEDDCRPARTFDQRRLRAAAVDPVADGQAVICAAPAEGVRLFVDRLRESCQGPVDHGHTSTTMMPAPE